MANSNFLLELLSGTLSTLGESKLVDVLQELYDNDKTEGKTDYKSAVFGGQSFVTGISKLTTKTKTQIDDAIVTAISEAIQASAKQNAIALPDENSSVEKTGSEEQ
jgi:hypothetical protein